MSSEACLFGVIISYSGRPFCVLLLEACCCLAAWAINISLQLFLAPPQRYYPFFYYYLLLPFQGTDWNSGWWRPLNESFGMLPPSRLEVQIQLRTSACQWPFKKSWKCPNINLQMMLIKDSIGSMVAHVSSRWQMCHYFTTWGEMESAESPVGAIKAPEERPCIKSQHQRALMKVMNGEWEPVFMGTACQCGSVPLPFSFPPVCYAQERF